MSVAAARVPAHVLFFPAAAAYAAAVVPLSVAAMLGVGPAIPGLASPLGHAHELLFGFALAAVAGNQLGPTRVAVLAAMLAAWIAARVAFVAAPGGIASALANGAFAAMLAWQVAPRLLGRAKKLRNRALPIAIGALCVTVLAAEASTLAGRGSAQRSALILAILLLALLMLFMGGRIVAPAAAGQMYRQGGDLKARVQPRIEGALIAAMFVAILATAAGLMGVAAAGVIAAGLLAFVRMARWRLSALEGRADLRALALGYAWLAAGLVALGGAFLADAHVVTALHLITVGAIGTLTVNVMALTWLRLARRDPARAKLPLWSTGLVAIAVFARVAADFTDARAAWLALAASAWCAAYLLLLLLFARVRRPPAAAMA